MSRPEPVLQRRRGRRQFLRAGLAAAGGGLLAGCDRLSHDEAVVDVLGRAESLSQEVQRSLVRGRLAQEFSPADIAPRFRPNGTTMPPGDAYARMLADGFASWRLVVDGLVQQPLQLSLAQLRAMPARSQITRHDCVEGWSCIGQWTGVRLSHLLQLARPQARARYVVFHCLDEMDAGDPRSLYYESVGMDDAWHEQTILAWELNGQPLPVENGAPLRVRVERQLGYKQPKYLHRIELVETLARHGDGRGGYWEDQGYAWYAGI